MTFQNSSTDRHCEYFWIGLDMRNLQYEIHQGNKLKSIGNKTVWTWEFVRLLRCLSVLDFWNVNLGVYYKLEKKSISNQTWFFFDFELDFYCLCSLQKSISKSNWFFSFLNLIFWNWKKFEWHSISQKSSGDRQGDSHFTNFGVTW